MQWTRCSRGGPHCTCARCNKAKEQQARRCFCRNASLCLIYILTEQCQSAPQKAAMQKEAKRQAALKEEARKKAKEQAKAAKANGGWVNCYWRNKKSHHLCLADVVDS